MSAKTAAPPVQTNVLLSSSEQVPVVTREVPKRRKRLPVVRWSKNARVVRLRPFPEHIRRDLWFDAEDFRVMKTRDRILVNMVKEGRFRETPERTSRGLEPHFDAVLNRQRRTKSIGVVLEEQKRQMSRGRIQPERIAAAYIAVTSNSSNLARLVGQQDELDASKNAPLQEVVQKEYSLADLRFGEDGCSATETDTTSEASQQHVPPPEAPPPALEMATPRMRGKKGLFKRWSSKKLGNKEKSWRSSSKRSVAENAQAEVTNYNHRKNPPPSGGLLREFSYRQDHPAGTRPQQQQQENDDRIVQSSGNSSKRTSSIRNMRKMLKSWSSRKIQSQNPESTPPPPPPPPPQDEMTTTRDVHFSGDAGATTPRVLHSGKKSSSIRNMLKTWSGRKLTATGSNSSSSSSPAQTENKDVHFPGAAVSTPTRPLDSEKKSSSRRDLRQMLKTWSSKKLGSKSVRVLGSPKKEDSPREFKIDGNSNNMRRGYSQKDLDLKLRGGNPQQMLKTFSQKDLVFHKDEDKVVPAYFKKDSLMRGDEDADPILPPPGSDDSSLGDMLRSWSTRSLRKGALVTTEADDPTTTGGESCKSPQSRKISAADFAGRGRVFSSPAQQSPQDTPRQTRKNRVRKLLGKPRTWSTDITFVAGAETEENSDTSQTSHKDDLADIDLSPRERGAVEMPARDMMQAAKGKSNSMRRMLKTLSSTKLLSPLTRQKSMTSSR